MFSFIFQLYHNIIIYYNIFISDIASYFLFSNFQLFTEGVKVYASVSSTKDCYKIQADLDRLSEWYNFNKLGINNSKCSFFFFF